MAYALSILKVRMVSQCSSIFSDSSHIELFNHIWLMGEDKVDACSANVFSVSPYRREGGIQLLMRRSHGTVKKRDSMYISQCKQIRKSRSARLHAKTVVFLPSDDSFQDKQRFSDLQNELGPECTLALFDPLGKALQPTALKFMSAKRLCEKVAKSPPLSRKFNPSSRTVLPASN